MGSSLFQMLYNITDLFWVGQIGAKAITAVGIVGYILWFVFSITLMPKVGVEVGIAQNIGRKNEAEAYNFSRLTLKFTILLSVVVTLACYWFSDSIIRIFGLDDAFVDTMAVDYLKIIVIGFIFSIINFVYTGIFTGMGDSKTPFIMNSIGLGINMLLDPILITGMLFGYQYGVVGAAYATVFSQLVVFVLLSIVLFRKEPKLLVFERLFSNNDKLVLKQMFSIGAPVAVQSVLFSVFAMIVARIVSRWGSEPMAVISIGANVEAISWMTASGFSTALGTFVGQNYGAGDYNRIEKAYWVTLLFSLSIGVLAGLFFYFFPDIVIGFFTDDINVMQYGVRYLKIVAVSQLFMCAELTTVGAFNGLGKTMPPAFTGVAFNGLRVASVFLLATYTLVGTDGVWWSISMSSVVKGSVLVFWFIIIFQNFKKNVQLN